MRPRPIASVSLERVSWLVLLAFAGCASGGRDPKGAPLSGDRVVAVSTVPPAEPPTTEQSSERPAETRATSLEGGEPGSVQAPTSGAPDPDSASTSQGRPKKEPGRSICRQLGSADEELIDEAHRKLYETLCGAALWFDGLFGERNEATVASARGVSGRLEISGLNSEYEGSKFRVRGNVRVDFPNLDNRFNAFIGRDDEDDFIRDRTEGLALRSQFLDFADENRWLAGLGYSLPGTYQQRTDFRVGGKLGSEPEIFVQGRLRKNWFINERNLWHFRETLFWTNRDGFGATTSFDFDHVLPDAPRLAGGRSRARLQLAAFRARRRTGRLAHRRSRTRDPGRRLAVAVRRSPPPPAPRLSGRRAVDRVVAAGAASPGSA
jgi:hypothetical protein